MTACCSCLACAGRDILRALENRHRWLLFAQHCYTCQLPDGACELGKLCTYGKKTLKHVSHCEAERDECPYPRCRLLKPLLSHSRSCQVRCAGLTVGGVGSALIAAAAALWLGTSSRWRPPGCLRWLSRWLAGRRSSRARVRTPACPVVTHHELVIHDCRGHRSALRQPGRSAAAVAGVAAMSRHACPPPGACDGLVRFSMLLS